MNSLKAPLFNPLSLQKSARAQQTLAETSLFSALAQRLVSRVDDTTHTFTSPLIASVDTGATQACFSTNAATLPLTAACGEGVTWPEKAHDLILSNLALPWCDPYQFLLNAGKALKGDGLLIATTLGPDSFQEFNAAFKAAGLAPTHHTGPFMDVRDLGQLLSSLKFALPVVDRDLITLTYPSFADLCADLRNHGGRNLNPLQAKGLLTPRQWQRVAAEYARLFTREDGLQLTLEVIYLHGWRPHISQQKPLKPGQYKVKLEEAL
jgi:SAM-dependent methyltransferase